MKDEGWTMQSEKFWAVANYSKYFLFDIFKLWGHKRRFYGLSHGDV
jgi:hypothetical protein